MSFYTHLLKENTYENTRISRIKLAKISFPGGASGKEPTCQCRRQKRQEFSLWVREIPLKEGMATHSSILAWRIPMDRGAWWATVHGVTKSWT